MLIMGQEWRLIHASSKTHEASQPHRFELLLMQRHRALAALFHIHVLIDAHDWLVSMWLTGERVCHFAPLAPSGYRYSPNIIRILTCDLISKSDIWNKMRKASVKPGQGRTSPKCSTSGDHKQVASEPLPKNFLNPWCSNLTQSAYHLYTAMLYTM